MRGSLSLGGGEGGRESVEEGFFSTPSKKEGGSFDRRVSPRPLKQFGRGGEGKKREETF